jgi:FkbM family methyltransferase
MTFLDIGANCGYYTALFLSRSGPESRVIAIEPDPQCFAFLERTVAANQGRNVTCLRMAASDGCGTARLYRNLDNRGDNRLYANDLATSFCEVETDTVDSMLERLGVRSVNLVKLDVQGFEGKVLRGMRKTLAEAPRLILMSEFWPHGLAQGGTDPSWVVEFLEGMGFHLFLLGGRGKLREMEQSGRVIRSYRGRRYTNIVATKGVDFRRWLDNHA